MILCAWLAIRVQDMQRTKFFLDEDNPAHAVRGVVTCSKSGEPINLFMPAKGVLGNFLWLQEHVARRAAGADGPREGGHRLSRLGGPVGLPLEPRDGEAARRGIDSGAGRDSQYFCVSTRAPPALSWPKGKLGLLGVKGHSMHVSLVDIARTIGRNPTFPFELDRAAARGFSRDDRRELGHWAGEAEMESNDEDAPVGAQAQRGRGRRMEGNGRASRRGAMDLVYSRGRGEC
jgi:hypothetical protein